MPTSLNQFADIIAVLGIAFREPLDQPTILVYHRMLEKFEPEFIAMAAEALAHSSPWFPKISEWEAAIRRKEVERQTLVEDHLRKLHLASPGEFVCIRCEDSGWTRDDTGRVDRCECQQLRRLEARGLRELPADVVIAKRLGP